MLTKLYLQTTDPALNFSDLLKAPLLTNIIISALLHTFIYASFINLASYIFLGHILSKFVNFRLTIALSLIMFFGFFARFFHVKNIYSAYDKDNIKTREHLDKLYIGWIFIS